MIEEREQNDNGTNNGQSELEDEHTKQAHNTKRSVLGRMFQVFERIDENLVRCSSRIKQSLDTKQSRDLGRGDGNSGTGHESSHSGCGDKLDNPTNAQETDTQCDETADEGDSGGYLW